MKQVNKVINPSEIYLPESHECVPALSKRTGVMHKQNGISLLDFIAWIGVVGLVLLFARPYIASAWSYGNAFFVQLQIANIKTAASEFHSYGNTYTNISMDEFERLELTAPSLRTNTFGGANSVAPGANPAINYQIVVDGITNDGVGNRLQMRFTGDNDVATYAGGTLTIVTTRN